MNKKRLIICSIILIILFGITNYLVYKPLQKNYYVKNDETTNKKKVASFNDESYYSFDLKIKSNYITDIEFFSVTNDHKLVDVNDINLEVKIFDDNNSLVYSNVFNYLSRFRNTMLFKEPILNSKDKIYRITFENKSEIKDYNIKLNDKDYVFTEQVGHQSNYTIIYWLYAFSFIDMIVLFMGIKESKKITKRKEILILLGYFASTFICVASLLYYSYSLLNKSGVNILFTCETFIVMSLAAFIGSCIFKNHKDKIEWIFLTLGIPIILLTVIFILPNNTQDEYLHYNSAYNYGIGWNLGRTNEVPSYIKTDRGFRKIKDFFTVLKENNYNYKDTKEAGYAQYSRIYYIVPTIIITIFRYLNINPYLGWWAAKLGNALVYLIIGYFIVKNTKKHKLLVTTYLLMPEFIYQAASLSIDAYINLSIVSLVSLMINKFYFDEAMSVKDYLILIIASLFAICSKMVYFPLVILVIFMIRKSIMKTDKGILKTLISIAIMFGIVKIFNNTGELSSGGEGFNAAGLGISYLIHHPFNGLYTIYTYLLSPSNADNYIFMSVGYTVGWIGTVTFSKALPTLYIGLLIASCLDKEEKIKKYNIIEKLFHIGAYMATFCLIILALTYLEGRSNPVVNNAWGVSGRYFVPMHIFLLTILANLNISKVKTKTFVIIGIIGVYILYLVNVIDFII